LFLLRTIVIVIVVIARFLYCTFIIYSSIRLSSRKCVLCNKLSVQCATSRFLLSFRWPLASPAMGHWDTCPTRLPAV